VAFVVGLATAGLTSEAPPGEAVLNALLRAGLMFGAFFAFRAGYARVRGIEGMGPGDVKLAAVAGVWLNWTDLPIAVDIAALSALASALLGRVSGKEYGLVGRGETSLSAFCLASSSRLAQILFLQKRKTVSL